MQHILLRFMKRLIAVVPIRCERLTCSFDQPVRPIALKMSLSTESSSATELASFVAEESGLVASCLRKEIHPELTVSATQMRSLLGSAIQESSWSRGEVRGRESA